MDDREPTYEELKQRVAELEARVEQLLKLLDEKNRSGKRQAAPFSKRPPKLRRLG